MLTGNYFNVGCKPVGEPIEFHTNDLEFAVLQVEALTDLKRTIMSRHFAVLSSGVKRMVIGKE